MRKKIISIVVLTIFALGLASAASSSFLRGDESAPTQVGYPDGFRQWIHVKSGVIGPESPMYQTEGGVHHVYANPTALAGLENGRFEDGAILVYDLISLSEKSGVGTEGARRRTDVMVKDSKRFSESGGWGFARFMGEDHEHDVLTPDVRTICARCHQKAHGFVFSEFQK